MSRSAMDADPGIPNQLGSRLGPGSRPTRLALILGVAGGLCWLGADLRRTAFTGLGTPGALDYSFGSRCWVARCSQADRSGEFVLFRDDNDLGSAARGWFVVGLGVMAVGLSGLGVRLAGVWRGAQRFVAWWLVASGPLVVAAFGLGLLGTSMGVGITALCAVLLWASTPESEIRRAG